jgi:hypothetical protein
MNLPLRAVPEDLPGAGFGRRLLACAADVGVSIGVGLGFGLLVYLDLGKMMEAGQGMGFMSMISFLTRDAMNVPERGTRFFYIFF